ncbi:MAG: hypothetical protein PHI32_08110 [Dysgonamonadaceae bacterium]|jgi:hypothetical protein|nr:hypothetical protein [Dysgonamonadaceae bacterium]
MSESSQIKVDQDIFKTFLTAASYMYTRKHLRLFIKPRMVEVEIDDIVLNKTAHDYDFDTNIFTRFINLLCNIIMAIFFDDLDNFKKWLDKEEVFVYQDFEELVKLVNDFLEQHPQIEQSYNFYKLNIGNVLRRLDWQINLIKKTKEDNVNIKSVKVVMSYYSSGENNTKSVELDLCADDVDYVINMFLNIKRELENECGESCD